MVQRATFIQAAYAIVVLMPAYTVMAVAAQRLGAGRLPLRLYEPIFATGMWLELFSYALTEVLIMRLTGCAVEWPAFGAVLMFAISTAQLHRTPPFIASVLRPQCAFKILITSLPLIIARRPFVLLSNFGTLASMSLVAFSIVRAKAREQAVRASFRRRAKNED